MERRALLGTALAWLAGWLAVFPWRPSPAWRCTSPAFPRRLTRVPARVRIPLESIFFKFSPLPFFLIFFFFFFRIFGLGACHLGLRCAGTKRRRSAASHLLL
ncbi:hypothetical protein JOL62DRAFT_565997, partial [Phyllosticta paracitricarpa]